MSARQFGPIGIRTRPNLRELLSPADIERFWSRFNFDGPVKRPELGPCHLWTGRVNEWGYGRFDIRTDGKHVQAYAHRLALELTIGAFDGLALHHCDTPPCGNGLHLFAGTQARNIADRDARQHTARGSLHGESILDEALVAEILMRVLVHREHQVDVAHDLGLDPKHLNKIVRRKTWRHVEVPAPAVGVVPHADDTGGSHA